MNETWSTRYPTKMAETPQPMEAHIRCCPYKASPSSPKILKN
jgi:hypothetical protein